MAITITLPSFHLLSSLLLLGFVVGNPNGLTIRLIHRDSPESPLYPGNLTQAEKIQRLIHQSIARVRHLTSSTDTSTNNCSHTVYPEVMRARVDAQSTSLFIAQVRIGTFSTPPPYQTYYLHIDTGSELIWMQCEDCKFKPHQCYPQIDPPFPRSRSRSYVPLLCNKHGLCYPKQCAGMFCSFYIQYADGSTTFGLLAYENFFFDSGRNGSYQSVRLVFGCGLDNRGSTYDKERNRIAGVLGMGWGPRSLLNQIGSASNGLFSYCFPQAHNGDVPTTLLKFGSDIVRGRNLSTTPLVKYSNLDSYYVNLQGLSVDGIRLNIPGWVFARKGYGRGGCVIDSGAEVSHIVDFAYRVLRRALVNYFARVGGLNMVMGMGRGLDLCYQWVNTKPVFDYPKIGFHFQGADLVVEPAGLFVEVEAQRYFCLAMVSSHQFDLTAIGAYQQINRRFIFDTGRKQLLFGPENCALNA